MEEKLEKSEIIENREAVIKLKLTNFWRWIKKSEESEGGHSVNIDKRIPGFASVFAVILFLSKEFIHYESDKGEVFTDLHFTLALQALNIIVLIIILVRGLKILPIDRISFLSWFSLKQIEHVELLEKEFVKFIKSFFGMTIMLYTVLIFNSLLLDTINGTVSEKKTWLENIRGGAREIVNNIKIISHDASVDESRNLSTLVGPLDTISKSMQQIVYNDSPSEASGTVVISRLHKIRRANDIIAEALLQIDDSFLKEYSAWNPMPDSIGNALKCMYHGNHQIDVNSRISDKDNAEMIIVHVLELIFSNLGALFLVYAFLVLYTKNVKVPNDENDQSLLSAKYLLTGHRGRQSKRIARLLYVLFFTIVFLTILQALLELCFKENADDIATVFTMVSGIFNALALSLLVARFESSSFFSTFSVLVILYLYANIQVLFGVFNIPLFKYPHLIEDVTLVIAFVGKCFLYLYVLWVLRTDRLKYYFYNRYFNSFGSDSNLKWPDFVRRMNPIDEKYKKRTSNIIKLSRQLLKFK